MTVKFTDTAVKVVVKVLKTRFPNLTVDEVLDLAFDILRQLGEATQQ